MTTSSTLTSPSILQGRYWQNLDKMDVAAADRDATIEEVAGVAALQDRYDACVLSIYANGTLCAEGRTFALLTAYERGLEELAALAAPTLASIDSEIGYLAGALRRAAKGPDATLVSEVRAVETRAAFGQMDPEVRAWEYLDLCDSGADDAACVAVENASGFAPLLAADIIELGRTARGSRALPDEAGALDFARNLRALQQASVAAARRHMSVGTTQNDPLQVANPGYYQIPGDGSIIDDNTGEA